MLRFDQVERPLHPAAHQLGFLLGTWRGEGRGVFHTVDDFRFEEEIVFSHVGRPWLIYQQQAWSVTDREALHTEVGFWRLVDDQGTVNAFISLTAGLDFGEGRLEGTSLSLDSRTSPMADGVERVIGLRREYVVDGESMDYLIWMETDQQPRAQHLEARLQRVE